MVKLRIERIDKEVEMPCYKREGDCGMDLRSAEDKVLKAGEKTVVKTGVRIALPQGHVGLIWDRSGMAAKNHIHCLAGVIEPTFRGEWGVVLHNLGKEDFVIEKNMRIAQLLVQPIASPEVEEVEEMEVETVRGEGAWGSSGYK